MLGGKARETSSRSRARPKTGHMNGGHEGSCVKVAEKKMWFSHPFQAETKNDKETVVTLNVNLSPI